ncbi:TPA: hypothetical protein QCX53_005621 [Bacillus cereus]|nr:hypothetical protein [Bacillus cereus]
MDKTINNIVFKQAANIKSEWTLDQNGRTFYYDLKGQMQTGWKEISSSFETRYGEIVRSYHMYKYPLYMPNKLYYFSPQKTDKFEKGEMYRDTKQIIDGKEYQLDIDGICLNPDGGPITGWYRQGDAWYYLSPTDDTKNWNGITFKKGEIMTGWLQPPAGDTYYLSPANGTKNNDGKVFDKGQMMTGWVQVNNNSGMVDGTGAWYYFDNPDNKRYKGILGRMLHDETASLKSSKGEYYDQYFNKNGTMG